MKYRLLLLSTICFLLVGCKDWEYKVEKNGIYFDKISKTPGEVYGGTYIGYMTETQIVQGFPCEKGWIHFDDNWKLRSFQLSEEYIFHGILFPKETWFHFPYDKTKPGWIVSFPYNYEVEGYLCSGSGGYKGTHTGFYDGGSLRSFFPAIDVLIDGVPCDATIFAGVMLHENGKIKSCKLSDNYQFNGIEYKKGTILEFNIDGKVIIET